MAQDGLNTIAGVPTATTAFVGAAATGPFKEPVGVRSLAEFNGIFGGDGCGPLDCAVKLFFQNGGSQAVVVRTQENDQTGFEALAGPGESFNILVLTPVDPAGDVPPATLSGAAAFARSHRAMLLVDAPAEWTTVDAAVSGRDAFFAPFGAARENAALYFPRLELTDRGGGRIEGVGASGAVAGLYAATDAARGVWKAPAGSAARLSDVSGLSLDTSDAESARLNAAAVNCLRRLPLAGDIVWGARTMAGDDQSVSEWKYVPVRRLALFIEESLSRGTQWAVFEPNDEGLWAELRLVVGAFMHTLFLRGAFPGKTAKDAYFVKCDGDTNSLADVEGGMLTILVGFAALEPAEFVVLTIRQIMSNPGPATGLTSSGVRQW